MVAKPSAASGGESKLGQWVNWICPPPTPPHAHLHGRCLAAGVGSGDHDRRGIAADQHIDGPGGAQCR